MALNSKVAVYGLTALVVVGGVGVGGARVGAVGGRRVGEKLAGQDANVRAELERRLAGIEKAQSGLVADRERLTGLGKQLDAMQKVVEAGSSAVKAYGDAPISERLRAADVVINVHASRHSAGSAIQAARVTVDAVVKAVRRSGISFADIRVDWSGVHYEEYNRKQYDARADVHVIVRNLSRVDTVIAAATAKNRPGVLVRTIRFDIDENRSAIDEARRAAVEDARETAAVYAAMIGKKIGPVLEIAESEAAAQYYDYYNPRTSEIEVEVTFALV